METRTLIPAHNAFHRPRNGMIKFVNRSNLQDNPLHPCLYSIVAQMDGTTTLTEYSTQDEFTLHRNAVFQAIANLHSLTGVRQGCCCNVCKR